jgi:uncharacterized protein YbdZ (MbtH family)
MTVVFTLDSIVALGMAFLILTASTLMLSEQRKDHSDRLYLLGDDILTIAEEDGSLKDTVKESPGGWEAIRFAYSKNACMSLSVKNMTGHIIYSDPHACPGANTLVRRSFMGEKEFYTAKIALSI